MAAITLRILHGADRGKAYGDLNTPVTIGREEGNTIQLNDDRISRYHLKLQSDNDKIVLTDLESTNGTKVNGEEIQVRIIRDGDIIALGRSVLLVGSHSDIERRIVDIASRLSSADAERARVMRDRLERISKNEGEGDSEVVEELNEARIPLLPAEPPPLPSPLGPSQAAELAELFDYIQAALREATESAYKRPGGESVEIDFAPWQAILDLQASLAELLRKVSEPGDDMQ
ncbi:MAG: FHA domain-containing protein [Pirellulales bacterium]